MKKLICMAVICFSTTFSNFANAQWAGVAEFFSHLEQVTSFIGSQNQCRSAGLAQQNLNNKRIQGIYDVPSRTCTIWVWNASSGLPLNGSFDVIPF